MPSPSSLLEMLKSVQRIQMVAPGATFRPPMVAAMSVRNAAELPSLAPSVVLIELLW